MLKSLDRFYIRVMAASLPAMRVYQACMASGVGRVFGQETKDLLLEAQAATNACIRKAEAEGTGFLKLHEQLADASYPLTRHAFAHIGVGVARAGIGCAKVAEGIEKALGDMDRHYSK